MQTVSLVLVVQGWALVGLTGRGRGHGARKLR